MRIAHVDSGRTWRGGQAQVWGLCRGLAARGHDLVVFSPRGPLADRLVALGLPWSRFESANDLDFAASFRLARAIARFDPDVVHLHSGRAHAVGARAAGSRPVVVSRRVDFDVSSAVSRRFKYGKHVDRFLCISEGVRRVLVAAGVEPAKLVVVPSGIDVERWKALPDSAPLRQRLGLAPDAPVLGTVAALAPHKDLFNLLAAAAILRASVPRARWVVFGEGELRERLERDREKRGLEDVVLFPGFLEDVGQAFALMDVFVLSSYLEGLGTSVLDAQAAGVAVVATQVGGVPEMIDGETNGWLVAARDPQALAVAVAEALRDREEAARRAARARDTVRRFSLDATVEATLGVYRDVVAERARRAS
ncbi:MAG TPA: glycosyltransferase [Candidatus Eisenbacteria bacterium]|nr:glycosyltransferase [Candidatus Eisenbacteria bacterium]